jgi:hypothetical protein
MSFLFQNPVILFRSLYLLNLIGTPVIYATSILQTAFKFVFGKSADDSEGHVLSEAGDENALCGQFSASVDNLLHMFPEISSFARPGADLFRSFHDFSLENGVPAAAVLMSERTECRRCGKSLHIDQNWKPIVVYHLTRGTYLGCRISKSCSNCKIYEHYGFFTESGNKTFDTDCLTKEFLMSTDETAIDMMLLRYVNEDVIQGAVSFLLKSKVYNTVHGYSSTVNEKPASQTPLLSTNQSAKKR